MLHHVKLTVGKYLPSFSSNPWPFLDTTMNYPCFILFNICALLVQVNVWLAVSFIILLLGKPYIMSDDCLQGVVIHSGTVRIRHVRSSADDCSQVGLTTFNVNRAPLDVEVDFPISKTCTDCTSEQLQDARATYRPRGIGLNDSTVFGTGSCFGNGSASTIPTFILPRGMRQFWRAQPPLYLVIWATDKKDSVEQISLLRVLW